MNWLFTILGPNQMLKMKQEYQNISWTAEQIHEKLISPPLNLLKTSAKRFDSTSNVHSTSASLTLAREWWTLIPRLSVVGRLSTATAVVHLFLFAPS